MPPKLDPEIYRAVLESLPLGVYLVDRNRQILFWNAEAERLTGYLAQEVIGRECHDNLLMHCDENQKVLCGSACPLAATMLDGRGREARLFLRHKDGARILIKMQSIPVHDEFGAVIGSAECFEEWSHRGSRSVPSAGSKEQTTGIADRETMRAVIEEGLKTFAASHVPFGILRMAIDKLEHLRHECGYQAVQAVSNAAAETLSSAVRPGDVVARFGEEELVALVECSTRENLLRCAQRLQRLVGMAEVPWWGDRLSVNVSIGGAIARDGDTVALLLLRAGDALAASQAETAESVLVV